MLTTRIEIHAIRRQVDAAEALQDAGKDSDARRILIQLANDIKRNIK